MNDGIVQYAKRSELMPDLDAHARICLLIVASVRLYRDGLASRLERAPLHVIDTATAAEDALAKALALAPDVIVLDMATPNSLALVRAVRDRMREVRVVAFAVDDCEPAILACVEAGVAGFVSSDGTADDLVNAVHGAARGEMLCSPSAVGALSRRLHSLAAGSPAADPLAALTAREREILSLVGSGLANKEISRRLHIELATVKNHVHHILEKLGVASRSEAAARVRTRPDTLRPRRSGELADPWR